MSPILSTFSGASARAFGFGYNFASSAFEHIETQTVGAGGAASITFSSIAGTYKHLQIRGLQRMASSPCDINFRLNSDNGSNYSQHWLYGDGAGAYSSGGFNTSGGYIGYHSAGTTYASVYVLDLLDYASTSKFKTSRTLFGGDANGSGIVMLSSSSWRSTSAVTSVTLYSTNSVNFAQYSSFSLYGVKA